MEVLIHKDCSIYIISYFKPLSGAAPFVNEVPGEWLVRQFNTATSIFWKVVFFFFNLPFLLIRRQDACELWWYTNG